MENQNLDGVSAKLHITLTFLRESLGRTYIWFEEDLSRAVPIRSLYYVGRCFATSCQCYFASITLLRASRRINNTSFITYSFFKLLWCFICRFDKYWCIYWESIWAQQSIHLDDLVILGICDLSGDYLSVLWSYMPSPKSVARSNRYQMTHLVVSHVYWTYTVRTFRSSPRRKISKYKNCLTKYLLDN